MHNALIHFYPELEIIFVKQTTYMEKENGGNEMRKAKFTVMAILMVVLLSACGCNHQWKDATCLNPKTCDKCGTTEGEALPHNWAAATCTEPKICMVCNITDGDPIGHDWENATCQKPTTCKICGLAPDNVLADHTCDNWTEIHDSTCAEEGFQKGLCKYCAKELVENIAVLPHSYSDWRISTEATCAAEGEQVRACTKCGNEEKESIAVLPHNLHEWTLTKEPSYGTDGEYTQACASCNAVINTKPYTYEESIAHLYTLKGEKDGFTVTDINIVYKKNSFFVRAYPMVEITNTGTSNLCLTNCAFDFVDNDNNLIGTVDDFSIISGPAILKPGEKGYFFAEQIYNADEIDINNGINVYAYIEVKKTTDTCVYLDIKDFSWKGSDPKAIGRIENNSGQDVDGYFVFALYRDANGRICNFGMNFEFESLSAGDRKSFEAPCYWREIGKAEDIAECEVIAFEIAF